MFMEFTEDSHLQNKILKNMSPAARLKIAFELNELARERLRAFLKEKNPGISPQELSFLIKKRFSE